MRRLPAELVVLVWIAAFAGQAAFIATVLTTPLPIQGQQGPGRVGFPINIADLPDDEATLTRMAHDTNGDQTARFAEWHKLGLVLARTGQPAAARTAQETAALYRAHCVPMKARLDLIYLRHRSFCYDLRLIGQTAARFTPAWFGKRD